MSPDKAAMFVSVTKVGGTSTMVNVTGFAKQAGNCVVTNEDSFGCAVGPVTPVSMKMSVGGGVKVSVKTSHMIVNVIGWVMLATVG